jgi:hypothetical protein
MTTVTKEQSTTDLTALQLQQIRQALQSLTLCHSQAPEAETALRRQTVWVGDTDVESTFELVSPQQTGKTAEYLEEFFKKDQKQAWSTEFSHPLISDEGVENEVMHCHSLVIKASDFIPSGIDSDAKGARYCLFARNDKGRITSFIRFSVSLDTFENVFGEYDPDDAEADATDAISFYLNINFDVIYTRARFRGRGASIALLSVMQQVVQDEVLHISQQLAPVSTATGVVFKLQPYVTSELNSQTGELAHNMLMEGLEMEREFHSDMLEEEPARHALEILEADDSDVSY